MRKIAIPVAILALIGVTPLAQADVMNMPCWRDLKALLDDWNRISLATPSKPAQMRILGREGHEHTGGQVNYMQMQLRWAYEDCQKSDAASVERRIGIVRNLLGHTGTVDG